MIKVNVKIASMINAYNNIDRKCSLWIYIAWKVLYFKYKYYIPLKMLNVTRAENIRGDQKVLGRHCKILVAFSVCLLFVIVLVNFSHFILLHQNHRANFNQTWHKASFGEEDACLFKWRTTPFSKER